LLILAAGLGCCDSFSQSMFLKKIFGGSADTSEGCWTCKYSVLGRKRWRLGLFKETIPVWLRPLVSQEWGAGTSAGCLLASQHTLQSGTSASEHAGLCVYIGQTHSRRPQAVVSLQVF